MKRIMILVCLVALVLSGCFLFSQDSPLKVIAKYDGEYYVFMNNTTEAGELFVYVTHGEGVSTWLWTVVGGKLGGDAHNLKVEVVKVLGEAYPDRGNLLVQLKENAVVLAEKVVPAGVDRATVYLEY